MENTEILVRHQYIPSSFFNISGEFQTTSDSAIIKRFNSLSRENKAYLTTLVSNMTHYGYSLSKNAVYLASSFDKEQYQAFWKALEPYLRDITGKSRNIDNYHLYKNFPKEVMDMDASEYWARQIFVYLGFPYDAVRQEEVERPQHEAPKTVKILEVADVEAIIPRIAKNLIASPKSWSDDEIDIAKTITKDYFGDKISVNDFGFKDNAFQLITFFISEDPSLVRRVRMKDATDVLRLAFALSNEKEVGDKKFASFPRSTRKSLVSLLNSSKNLEEDMAMNPNDFKTLLSILHPGDFKWATRVSRAYDKLYNNRLRSFNSIVEEGIARKDDKVLLAISTQPGAYIRRFHKLYEVFGSKAVDKLISVLDSVDTMKLLGFKGYITSINNRAKLIAPYNKGWKNPVVSDNKKVEISSTDIERIVTAINNITGKRIKEKFGSGFNVSESLKDVKLKSNNQELAQYGRGTVFDIPENISFIRTSSYWSSDSSSFLDNTWNFLDSNGKILDACCWNSEECFDNGAVFSGDAINRNKDGIAAQFIDLNIEKLVSSGVRYALWSALSYSHIPFSDFNDVHMGMQFGEDQFSGRVFEASRVQLSLPIEGDGLSKLIAYVDLVERKLVYLDLNLGMRVSSGMANSDLLMQTFFPILEHLTSLPSVYDLLVGAQQEDGIPATYSDAESSINSDTAYIFKRENAFTSVSTLLSMDDIVE